MRTGVDRVEFAYLRALSRDPVPCWGLIRTPLGYVLLAPEGVRALADRLETSESWPAANLLARLGGRGQSAETQAALTFVRSWAAARVIPSMLPRLLAAKLPQGTDYFNVGHSNLTPRVLGAVRKLQGRVAIFIHDVIPMDYPQFQRLGTVEPFRNKMRNVQKFADILLCNSTHTAQRAQAIMSEWGDVPRSIVSHLGTDLAEPAPSELPSELRLKPPYFVSLGTIEPRKNHALLLDIWEEFGDQAPGLVICGSRGWRNEAVFARLDALPENSAIVEAPGLSDGAIAALMQNAQGLLLPSFAEGYGLPAVEAAARGVPVLAAPLPAIHETLGNIPVYLSPTDRYQWSRKIQDLAVRREICPPYHPPTWEAHFKTVLSMI